MLDFRKLEAFCKVYELKSFSQAGKELFLSQPTISAHVLSLEKELGVQLLDRMGRVVLPTAAGEILYQHSRQAFSALDSARAEIMQLQDEVTGQIIIGGSTIPAHYMLPQVMASYRRNHPAVKVEMRVGDTDTIAELVAAGAISLGIVGAKEAHPELVYDPLVDDELVLIAAPDLLPEVASLTTSDLPRFPWVMREPGSGTRKTLAQALAERGGDIRRLEVSVSVDSTQAAVQCVKAGLGLTMTSRLVVTELVERGELVIIPLDDLEVKRNFYCVHHGKRHFFPAVTGFMKYLQEQTAHLRNA